MKKLSRLIIGFSLACLLVILPACGDSTPSRFEGAQQESIDAGRRDTAVSTDAEDGSSFNRFFPPSEGNYERVFTQEKDGFVEAILKDSGQNVATLGVFDTISNPSAKDDFVDSQEQIGGYPVAQKGSRATAVLVEDRFQVTVRSMDDGFSVADRETWLGKFDLDGLASLN
ncbi:hypothetical protein A5482_012970 [Cyanobacterium sp. IPPAS B-1200]|uniref:hypothetical protein n=1 Tax=Cyanobacterium sp. IPPAS B-1200 TaxID=1562720 RepID=UPI0008527D00|nr:hypothetical protein [Cyanobacterium sp. IPPAS B-1200]OEJ77611.1 hypothetical protein A5482_04810 [Cyanobacterium sp. IPPAS B-1200]